VYRVSATVAGRPERELARVERLSGPGILVESDRDYPIRAQRMERPGRVSLICVVENGASRSCEALREEPANYRYAEFAIRHAMGLTFDEGTLGPVDVSIEFSQVSLNQCIPQAEATRR
jgi:hypothetical protein